MNKLDSNEDPRFMRPVAGHSDRLLLCSNLKRLPDSDSNPNAVYSMDINDLNQLFLGGDNDEGHVKVHFLVDKHIPHDSVAFMCEFYALPDVNDSNQFILRSACMWND